MWVWLLKRIGQVLPTLFILSILIFGLQQLMPGDPALILAGEERGDPQVLAQIRAELRLDRPISPTMPRRKASTQAMKITPWITVTQAPISAR